MSTAFRTIQGNPTRWDGLLDCLQMLSGGCLIAFMLCHTLLVSSVILGPGVLDGIAGFFESTGLAQVGGPLVFVLFIAHFLLAARKLPIRFESQKVIWDHARMMSHGDTWLWGIQAVTAMIILLMGTIHVWEVLTDLPITAAKTAENIQGGAWLAFFLILIPVVWLHTGVGLYRIAVKWSFIQDNSRKAFKNKVMMLVLAFMGIGFVTLLRVMFLDY